MKSSRSIKHIDSILRSILLIFLTLFFCLSSFSQDKNIDLLKKITLKLTQSTFVYTLATLSQDYKIPIGWEKSSKHSDRTNINIDVKEMSLKDVLDLIVKQEPEYKWELENGVINFTPSQNRKEFISAFLNLHIEQIIFPKEKENDAYSLRKSILNLPEVVLLMNSKGITDAGFLYQTPSNQPIFPNNDGNLTSSDLIVKEFLNKIVIESDHHTWVVDMVGKNKDKLLIAF